MKDKLRNICDNPGDTDAPRLQFEKPSGGKQKNWAIPLSSAVILLIDGILFTTFVTSDRPGILPLSAE